MLYTELLKKNAEHFKTILCFGIDPELEKIPIKEGPEKAISMFYLTILERMKKEKAFPSTIKPNIAFFEQYGFEGLRALKTIITPYKKEGMLVILDAKRGDIGKTSVAYAKAVFEEYRADAVTVAPYMGTDSVQPFLEHKEKGVYILARTSNKGARDFQDLVVDGEKLYVKVSRKIIEWGSGAVVGATYPAELEELSSLFVSSGKEIPLLIPGVGSQGGNAADVVAILRKTKNPLSLHRINSSSGISYAYQKSRSSDYAGAAVEEIKRLNKEIGY